MCLVAEVFMCVLQLKWGLSLREHSKCQRVDV